MRIAVCFHGLTRSLDKTLPGIQDNLLGPLRAAGAECSIFLHCLTLDSVTNSRSGEHDCKLDANEWKALCPPGPNALTEPQEHVDKRLGHGHYQGLSLIHI